MKGFLNKVQQKKGASDGKPAGGESNVRVDISLPKTQRRYNHFTMEIYRADRFENNWDHCCVSIITWTEAFSTKSLMISLYRRMRLYLG